MSAELYLTTESGSNGEVWASHSKVLTSFDGNANWNNATSSTTWNAPGAYHSSDTSVPISGAGLIDSEDSSVFGNITEVIQQALAQGVNTIHILVQPEENFSSVDGRIDFFSSDEASEAFMMPRWSEIGLAPAVTLRSPSL